MFDFIVPTFMIVCITTGMAQFHSLTTASSCVEVKYFLSSVYNCGPCSRCGDVQLQNIYFHFTMSVSIMKKKNQGTNGSVLQEK